MTELSAFWENVKGSSGKGERTMREKVCLLLLLVLLLTGCGAQKDAVKAEGPETFRDTLAVMENNFARSVRNIINFPNIICRIN